MIYSTMGFFSLQHIIYFFLVVARDSNGITTTHYNRPPELSRIENKIEKVSFPNISIAERQKRLLPYINHYSTQNNEPYSADSQYEFIVPTKSGSNLSPRTKFNALMGLTYEPTAYETPQSQSQPQSQPDIQFTPFLASNAVPGGFVPMMRPPTQPLEVNYVPFEQTKKIPNYGAVYDKLSQLKLRQSALGRNQVPRYIYTRKPHLNYIANFIANTTPNTFVHTYNPTNIDVQPGYNIPQEITITENPLRVTQLDNPSQEVAYSVQKQPPQIQEVVYQQPKDQIYQTLQKQPPQIQEVVYQQPKDQIYQTLQKQPPQIQEVVYQQPKDQIYQTLQKQPQQIQEVVYRQIQKEPKEQIYQTLQKQPQQIHEVRYEPIQKQSKLEIYQALQKQPHQIIYTHIPKQSLHEQKIIYPAIQKPRPTQQDEVYQTIPKQPQYVTIFTKNPQLNYIIQGRKPNSNQSTRQYLQEVVPTTTKSILVAPQVQYTPSKSVTPKPLLIYQPLSNKPYTFEPTITHNGHNYEPVTQTIAPTPTTENPNSLSVILRKLQESNTLPHTITPNNVDNSIKTLVRILSSLKAQTKPTRPIIVQDENDYDQEEDNEADVALNNHKPNRITSQKYPADTLEEGGTPGKPGIDYPALSTIPTTAFNCTTQRYKGFFADPDTHCQVWHYCDLNGGQASFLCPNGTIFSQVALTCDWWFNVKCSTTTQLYVLNERLYKYIIPLQPKFPEDYTGPLVDKYLALKFKEMEEKMKEKKETESDSDKIEEIDELQLLEDKNNESSTLAANHKK